MYQDKLEKLYRDVDAQKIRYEKLTTQYKEFFADANFSLFSAPGRPELSGNHTDHNNGKVLAASIDLDIIAAAAPNNSNLVTMHYDGYNKPFVVDILIHTSSSSEHDTTEAIHQNNFDEFLELVNESGNSSFKYLQNIFPVSSPEM